MIRRQIKTYTSQTTLLTKNKVDSIDLCEATVDNFYNNAVGLGKIALNAVTLAPRYYEGVPLNKVLEWSSMLNIPYRDLLLANLSYEVAQAAEMKILGCTSVAILDRCTGPIHIRNMDWDGPLIGATSAIIDTGKFLSVSNPGLSGTASGMVSGGFTVTLNWAPPNWVLRRGWSPLALVQYTLENCKTYKEAIEELSQTYLNTSAIFMVTGASNEGCVVERTPREYALRYAIRGVIVATNHYMCDEFEDLNTCDADVLDFSVDRYHEALESAHAQRKDSAVNLHQILTGSAVMNETTVQQMVFNPTTGYHDVRAIY